MNQDYAYCIGDILFNEKALAICKNCKRYITGSEPVEDTLILVMPQYDEKTESCPLNEPKNDGKR